MGQELADRWLLAAILDEPGQADVSDVAVTGLRVPLGPGYKRLPLGKVQSMPWAGQVAVGAWLYRGLRLVHRLDLRLPPAAALEILTVRDLAPLRFPDEGSLPSLSAGSIRRAAIVVCPSRFSAGELQREFGRDDVRVIRDGVDEAFFDAQPLTPPDRARLGLPDRWVLHTGGAALRKNLAGLAAAWPSVVAECPGVELVMCGPPDARRSALFDRLPAVRLMGKVPRPLLVQLVASASVVVVPSVYEGYGLPVQEAMAAGVPIVATAAASLPEVAGPGTILVDNDPEALAAGLRRALDGVDAGLLFEAREEARSRSWAASARAYLEVYAEVAQRRLRDRSGRLS